MVAAELQMQQIQRVGQGADCDKSPSSHPAQAAERNGGDQQEAQRQQHDGGPRRHVLARVGLKPRTMPRHRHRQQERGGDDAPQP
jgi:hypothetical protein